jgi:NAD(P)H-quinone oxidoreductase subunit 5
MINIVNGWWLPAFYATGLLLSLMMPSHRWKIARNSALLGLFSTLATIVLTVAWSSSEAATVDQLGLTLSLLIALLGWVIISFSQRYLDGEPNQPRFVKAMLFTLTCVSVLVMSQHLLVIVASWTGSSIGLHFLLTFYKERKVAQLVAHKKFIVSRLADLSLVVALVLIFQSAGTLNLTALADYLTGLESLPLALHWAAVLCAFAAILKCAQIPLHGWLIQVMEAPTPVSALLHAGVVNIGGFFLIRLADLINSAAAAQTMLVIVGSVTAALSGLVMMTRISIKVRLAWSTCGQMGFMLMEIGLGLYELALLHLVAHSLYKAHAFLNAGNTVADSRKANFLAPSQARTLLTWQLLSVLVSAAIVAGSVTFWQQHFTQLNLPFAAALIVALGLAPLLWFDYGKSSRLLLLAIVQVALLTQLYLLWHTLFAGLAPTARIASFELMVWVGLLFSSLYAAQIWLRAYPRGRVAAALYPWAYAGFYLDETFTRVTFKLWPAPANSSTTATPANRYHKTAGELS